MAQKFFNQKVKNRKGNKTKIIIIVVCLIVIIASLIIFITTKSHKKGNQNQKIVLRDQISLEINSKIPDKDIFFKELANVDENDIKIDYSNIDFKNIGNYTAIVELYNKKYKVKVNIVDTIAPNLVVKNITINKGEKYKATDFVTSCTDNSNKECKIDFYNVSLDENGNKIDYSKYEKEGTYDVQIIATDEAKNHTIKKVKLIIGTNTKPKPNNCKFGNNEYDKDNYTMSLDISTNGCALESKVNQNENILKEIDKIYENETNKLLKEFKLLNINDDLVLKRNRIEIPNKEKTGIVGYQIEITITINNEIKEKYTLNSDGTRNYSINKYNLK